MSLSVAATAAILQDINEMLRLCGELPVPSLQTDTNSVAGRAESVYHSARRRLLLQKWHANTEVVTIEKDGSDHFVAPDSTLQIDTTGVSCTYDVLLRDGMLYDLANNTSDWADGPDELVCEVVYDYYPDRLPPGLRRAILTQAAHDYLLGQLRAGGSIMDQRLFVQSQRALNEALRENSDQLDLSGLDTRHAWETRGERPFRNSSPDGRYW